MGPERIMLRDFVIDDWKAVHEVTSRSEVSQYQPWSPNTPEETRAYVQASLQAARQFPRVDYAFAASLASSDRIIGYGSLWLRSKDCGVGEIGYFLHPDWWGQGFGTEISTALLRFGFQKLHLHRLLATCDPRNTASKRVLEKIGMVYEERLHNTMRIRDGWRDSDIYGLSDHEWKALT